MGWLAGWLTDEERDRLQPAESALPRLPIPVQAVSSDEFVPLAQTARQREMEKRLQLLGARKRINDAAGSRRAFAHAIFTPGYPGWLEQIDRAIETLKPYSFKGYTIGGNTNKHLSKHPWRLDDEKLAYPAYGFEAGRETHPAAGTSHRG